MEITSEASEGSEREVKRKQKYVDRKRINEEKNETDPPKCSHNQ